MDNKTIHEIYSILKKESVNWKVPVVDLIQIQTKDPFKVLVATILSARTKDSTTVEACKRLFKKVNDADDLARIPIPEIEKLIYPVGFYKNKAIHLSKLPDKMQELYDGNVPDTVEELVELPSVGRKTANLVVAVAFEKPAICVDTHVHRIMNIFGYVKTKTPFETEMALRKKLPIELWEKINSLLVAFGQHLCFPVSPMCSKCPIHDLCPRIGVKRSR